MKILFVWSAAEFSTFDVARGYSNALKRMGHEVFDFRTYARIKYHALALGNDPVDKEAKDNVPLALRLASEGMVVEALRYRVDLVVAICGMGLHPDGLELLTRAGFPIALYFTEAPYDDKFHITYAQHIGHVFTNDRWSARAHGWGYLAHAYDPEIHRPRRSKKSVDVLVIGTGWKERQQLLEGVDWTGINLQIRGWWMGIKKGTPLWPYYKAGPVDNERSAKLYSTAKVCINQHRFHADAESLNPRAMELAACGALQVSDWRAEAADVFGDALPIYASSATLEFQLRRLLAMTPEARQAMADEQRAKVGAGAHTFDDRAAQLMAAITSGGTNGEASWTERAAVHTGRGG